MLITNLGVVLGWIGVIELVIAAMHANAPDLDVPLNGKCRVRLYAAGLLANALISGLPLVHL